MKREYWTIVVPQQEVAGHLNANAEKGWRLVSAFPAAQGSFHVMCILEKETETVILHD